MTEVEGEKAYVSYLPIGVVYLIMPWNFPLWQAMRAAVPIMLAGNGAALKHAPNCVASAYHVQEAFEAAGAPMLFVVFAAVMAVGALLGALAFPVLPPAVVLPASGAPQGAPRRFPPAVWAGIFYLITGLLGATVASLFTALPGTLVAAIAGIALFGTIGNSLAGALHDANERDAALIAFLVTASGLTLLGIGSAFWGLLFGVAARHVIPRHPSP